MYKPQSLLWVFYPPLRGIVQLTNFPALRYGNWSFTNNLFAGTHRKNVEVVAEVRHGNLMICAIVEKEVVAVGKVCF